MRSAATLLVLFALGCETDIPPAQIGRRVSGQVTYGGNAHAMYARPAVIVALFSEFPPMGPPRGIVTIERPDFSQPIGYEIVGMASGNYKIVGQVVDLSLATADGAATGSFPNFCILFAPVANIMVTEDAAKTGVDFTIYDPGRDPCLRPRPDAGVPEPDAAPAMEPDAAAEIADAGPDAT